MTIAGSDSGGGAGIQADIKSIHANGGFAISAITSVTAQNTCEVTSAFDLPIEIIEAQIDTVFADFEISAVKTGMLSNAEIVQAVAKKLGQYAPKNIVVDPVMISKSGFPLLQEPAIETIISSLIPLATILTPNVHEAQLLSNMTIQNVTEAKAWMSWCSNKRRAYGRRNISRCTVLRKQVSVFRVRTNKHQEHTRYWMYLLSSNRNTTWFGEKPLL